MRRINHLKATVREEEIVQQSMFYCPYGREHYNCFFLWLQKRNTREKKEWYQKLSTSDKRELVQCHRNCQEGNLMQIDRVKKVQHN